jgi:hypothetical protein
MIFDRRFPDLGMNAVGENVFVVRAKNNPNVFLHRVEHLSTPTQLAWQLKMGEHGAELFSKKQVDEFLKAYGKNDLECVAIVKVIGTDFTMN